MGEAFMERREGNRPWKERNQLIYTFVATAEVIEAEGSDKKTNGLESEAVGRRLSSLPFHLHTSPPPQVAKRLLRGHNNEGRRMWGNEGGQGERV